MLVHSLWKEANACCDVTSASSEKVGWPRRFRSQRSKKRAGVQEVLLTTERQCAQLRGSLSVPLEPFEFSTHFAITGGLGVFFSSMWDIPISWGNHDIDPPKLIWYIQS